MITASNGKMNSRMSRRHLLKTVGTGVVSFSAASYSHILGANDRVNLGVIGCGNRGSYLMQVFQQSPAVKVAAVCDVFGQKAIRAQQSAPGARTFGDHREMLEQKDVDIVLVATPDHWHTAASIDSMNAGKDVYVEKPLTFRLEEGPAIIQAAKDSGRICQVGLQQRSGNVFLKAKREIFDTGLLGRVSWVQTVWHLGVPYDLGPSDDPQPTDLDWRRFLGQLPWQPWNPHHYHHYRFYLDFGGGALTDLFTHWVDVVHMFMGQDTPKSVTAMGGIYVAKDDRTTPDTVNVEVEYDGFNVTYESTNLPSMPEEHIVFYGTEGSLSINRSRYEFRPEKKGVGATIFEAPKTLDQDHIRNFLECCRSRRTPNCTAEQGHKAAQVSILAKMSYMLKRRIDLNALDEMKSSGASEA